MLKKVSIIVPIYNAERFLASTLDSLVNQSLHDIDIICINDGSTDRSLEICEQFKADYPEIIRIFTKPNGGKASALNFGIQHTNAEYVVCIDADTKLYPNAVSLMMLHFLDKSSNEDRKSVV